MKDPEFEEYKRLEYLGDGLLRFISRVCLCTDWARRDKQRSIEFDLASNQTLAIIAIELKLQPFPGDPSGNYGSKSKKPFANALEVELYRQYQSGGMDQAEKYFRTKILLTYHKLKHEGQL